MAGNLIVVAGTPGAGKSSILEGLKPGSKYSIVNLGSLMKEAAAKAGRRMGRDSIRYLSFTEMEKLRKQAFGMLLRMEGDILLDTHLTVERGGKFVPGLPYSALKHLGGIRCIIYIDAKSSEILARRRRDTSRKRESENEGDIELQRWINLSMLAQYGAHLNIPFYIIHNRERRLADSIKSFKAALEDLGGK